MRKNLKKALELFGRGVASPRHEWYTSAIWTNGDVLWSYITALARIFTPPRVLVLNVTYYSKTTSVHQNALRAIYGDHVVEVEGVPGGLERSLRYLEDAMAPGLNA